jgi:CheY-like chemotaxis protein
MNGVLGMTDLLLDTDLTAEQLDHAKTIRQSAAALLTVINDVLDYSKIEAGKLDLERIDVDIRETVSGTVRVLETHAQSKGLELQTEIAADVPRILRGDSGRLRQVLLNLCGNAVKFTPAGKVLVTCGIAHRDARSMLLRFEVRDTGIGISAEQLSGLFRPFVQADASMTRKFGGTGLGLSIVKRLVELMGGEVGAHSVQGRGSTFWFTARLGIVAERESSVADRLSPAVTLRSVGSSSQATKHRVLLVEDNVVNQKVAARQLQRLNYDVDTVGDGDAAVRAWRTGRYDLILMDCQMPCMDGYEATRQIRADEAERRAVRIPIVALTAHAMQGAAEECLAAGMDDYLTKPIERERLVACMRRWLVREPATIEVSSPQAATG